MSARTSSQRFVIHRSLGGRRFGQLRATGVDVYTPYIHRADCAEHRNLDRQD